MDDVRGDVLRPPHDTAHVAIIANENKTEILSAFQSSEPINERGDGPYLKTLNTMFFFPCLQVTSFFVAIYL